jgi:hypothetical protein
MLFSPLTLTLSPEGRGEMSMQLRLFSMTVLSPRGDEYAAPSVLNDGPLPQGERGDEF